MKLAPKYFNIFLVIVALIAAVLIAFFTVNSQQNKTAAFEKRMAKQDFLQMISWPSVASADSIRISDFENQWVLLQFWSNWTDQPSSVHRRLAKLREDTGGRLTVISAMVGFEKEAAVSYVNEHAFPMEFVAGSRQFSEIGIPGLPAYLLLNPAHRVTYVSLGTLNEFQTDSLKRLITIAE